MNIKSIARNGKLKNCFHQMPGRLDYTKHFVNKITKYFGTNSIRKVYHHEFFAETFSEKTGDTKKMIF